MASDCTRAWQDLHPWAGGLRTTDRFGRKCASLFVGFWRRSFRFLVTMETRPWPQTFPRTETCLLPSPPGPQTQGVRSARRGGALGLPEPRTFLTQRVGLGPAEGKTRAGEGSLWGGGKGTRQWGQACRRPGVFLLPGPKGQALRPGVWPPCCSGRKGEAEALWTGCEGCPRVPRL